MIYFYKVRVKYYKGSQPIIKDYTCNFLELFDLLTFIKTKHKDNFELIFIKENKRRY